MTVTERWSTHPEDVGALDGADLRRRFVADGLFGRGEVTWTYLHDDRLLIGGAVLVGEAVVLEAPAPVGSGHLLDRRELAVVALEGAVEVVADGARHDLGVHDVLYLPRGTRSVRLAGTGVVYLVSAPAHTDHPAALASRDDVEALHLGSNEGANERVIRKYVHADGIASCQLVVGITTLSPGSVWNTMPAHTHSRRTEVYLYDGLGEAPVVHLMGEPHATRSLLLHDREAVVSPGWSIHSGAATREYSFVWAMAGENVDYTDVVGIEATDLA